jgi:predicted N-formylglutamate amidohydrolase
MRFDSRQVLVSCEHAGNLLPDGMEASPELLALHIAWDPGALRIAECLAEMFGAPLHAGKYSRLVVDLNRTVGNSVLVRRRSDGHRIPFNRDITEAEVQRRIERYYRPYRDAVSGGVARIIERHGRCVHLCIHTYTPALAGRMRGNDIGLLYDPHRDPEAPLVRELRHALAERTGLVVWLNRPYSGTADGILPRIREVHDAGAYVAIELEVNQKFADRPGRLDAIAAAFGACLRDLGGWEAASRRREARRAQD